MTEVRLYCGTGRSGRAEAMDGLMRAYEGRGLLIAPSHAYAAHRREGLLLGRESKGAWGNPAQSFTEFVRGLLAAEGRRIRQLDDFERRLLLERCLRQLAARGLLKSIGAGPDNAGLAAHLLRVLTQLKQAAVEPEAFRARLAPHTEESPFHHIVAEVYDAYQAALKAGGWYDVPGLYWEADACCKTGKPHVLGHIDALLFDGFDDFTPSEFRLIKAIAPHVQLMALGLNCDLLPGRKDLYALPKKIVDKITREFQVTATPFETPPPRRFSEYAADTIFWRDTPRFPSGLTPDLTVAACANRLHEIESMGRRIKRLIQEHGVPPGRIAVVFRHLAEHAGAVRAVFTSFGIPLRVQYHPCISESAVGVFLLGFFEAQNTWARETTLDALTSPFWRMERPEMAAAAPLLARAAQIIAGYGEWTTRLESFAARIESSNAEYAQILRARMPEAAAWARALAAEAARCKRLMDTLPAQGTGLQLAEAFEALLDALLLEETIGAEGDAAWAENERSALAAARRVLMAIADLEPGEMFTRGEFVERFRRGLQETTYITRGPSSGVVCMDAAAVRNLSFDYVFFGGLNEGVVPSPPPINAIYSERDVDRLRKMGVAMEGRGEHSAREQLLFHHVLASAQKGITLFWRLEKDAGREASASPFLKDIKDLFRGHADIAEPAPRADSLVPQRDAIAGEADLRNVVFFHKSLRAAYGGQYPAQTEAAVIESVRQDASEFGVYDGVLADTGLVAALARRYGDSHQFSVNQLETYLECPFRFYAERVLGVAETEMPEAEFDPRVRGTILHDILERFHRHYAGRAARAIPGDEGLAVLREITADAFQTHAKRSITAPPGLAAMEQRRMESMLARYMTIAREADDADWRPEHFEVSFGAARGGKRDPLSTEAPYTLKTDAGLVHFAGRIDRIDRDGPRARIIDYKTYAPPASRNMTEGLSLQLTVYLWALTELLLPETESATAAFVQVGCRLGKKSPYRTPASKDAQTRETNARAAIARAITGIREGHFPPVPIRKGCAYCPFRDGCRYEAARIARKPGVAPASSEEESGE